MNKIFLIVLLGFLFCNTANAQTNNKGFKERFERVYPYYNLTFYTGVGIMPLGTASMNLTNKSNNGSYATPNLAEYLGVSYKSNKFPIGVFADFVFNQAYYGGGAVFDWVTPEMLDQRIYDDGILILRYLNSISNSANIGILYGNEVADGLEINFKMGIGNSWHEYEVRYSELFDAATVRGGDGFKKTTINHQVGINVTYFPYPYFGFSGSFSVSNYMPVYTLSGAFKFGYKYRK